MLTRISLGPKRCDQRSEFGVVPVQAISPAASHTKAAGPSGAGRRILVVDDSRVQRRILTSQLARAGYEVSEAASAEEALDLARQGGHDLVISDWVMQGMTGLELCSALRACTQGTYVYFILLTSKSETSEIAHGLDSGADDFLTKPVSGDELRARLAAGERILRMERELTEKNRQLGHALTELQSLYDTLDRDLVEARKLQQSLVRDRHRRFGPVEVSLLLQPSGHVGGDLVGAFPINARRIGVYAIDVSGHGITSALMTARLAGFLSSASPDQNIALMRGPRGGYEPLPPDEVAAKLNRIVLEELETDTYFTLLYADIDLGTGRVAMVQAGHPHPMILRRDGGRELLGQGGLPIGLVSEARYETILARLAPGDRLLVMSDGITEVCDPAGRQISPRDLDGQVAACSQETGPEFLAALLAALGAYSATPFSDDISAVLIEFHGARPAAA